MLVVFRSLSFVCQEGNFFLWYIQMNQFHYFPPVDFLVHNRLNLFFLPYACWALIYITGGYKPECKLWSYLRVQSAWKMKDFSSLQTKKAWNLCVPSKQPGSQMGPWESTRGSLQGQQGLHWADCKIGMELHVKATNVNIPRGNELQFPHCY